MKVDLSYLNDLECINIVFSLQLDNKDFLKEYPLVVDRIKSSINFANKIRFKNYNESIKEAESYLRASLSEFVSIEEVLKIYNIRLTIFENKHPLLIIIKLLRNIMVHIDTSKLHSTQNDVYFQNKQINFEKVFIQNLTFDDLLKTRALNPKIKNRYFKTKQDVESLKKALFWFNKTCDRVGINEVLLEASKIYYKLITNEIKK